ncbi:MAG: flavodoxin family protein [Candidatus Gracilibacteria bacterium]|nr:flavodoxin family protein [Candidatus Gracilibacteria bacterium]MDD4530783.1 flavodoxin family protein [Candidatus Gracilibacteria bacterium]
MKILLISGSPRKGNTEFVLNEIQKSFENQSKIILLRDKKISHCKGCFYCNSKPKCAIKDDMEDIYKQILEAEVVIIGSPNYFDNITGLLKNFIDRLHPFYKTKPLEGKKLIQFMVGGGEIDGEDGTQKFLDITMYGLTKHLNFNLIGSYSFKALNNNDLEKDMKSQAIIRQIIEKIINKSKNVSVKNVIFVS